MDRRELGRSAETAALQFLESRGQKLVAKNFHCRFGEIDLIMLDGSDLVFVEVRYRKDQKFGGAIDSIDHAKQSRILKSAESFLHSGQEPVFDGCRFDVIAVSGSYPGFEIEWIEDAFQSGF